MKAVLAYSGDLASAVAAAVLTRNTIEVVTVTLDLGQADPLDEIRARALASGAVRAHVIDARDSFARTCILPALQQAAPIDVETVVHPIIAAKLVEVAAIECADVVATASTTAAFDAAVLHLALSAGATAANDATVRVLAPVRELGLTAGTLREYASALNVPQPGALRPQRNLLVRPSVDPSHAPDEAARLTITLEDGVPVAMNSVPMALIELIESLSLIAGQHGIGYGDTPSTPALTALRAVYANADGPSATIHLKLEKGSLVVSPSEPERVMVTPA